MIAKPHGPPSMPISPPMPDLKPDMAPLATPARVPPNDCMPPFAVPATRAIPDSSCADERVSLPSTISGVDAERNDAAIFPPTPSAERAYCVQFRSASTDVSSDFVHPLLRAVRVSSPAANSGVGTAVIADANPCSIGSDNSTASENIPSAAVAIGITEVAAWLIAGVNRADHSCAIGPTTPPS